MNSKALLSSITMLAAATVLLAVSGCPKAEDNLPEIVVKVLHGLGCQGCALQELDADNPASGSEPPATHYPETSAEECDTDEEPYHEGTAIPADESPDETLAVEGEVPTEDHEQHGEADTPPQTDEDAADKVSGTTLIAVPAGAFEMGRDYPLSQIGERWEEYPVHDVYLNAYKIGKYPVTNADFASMLNWAAEKNYLYIEGDGSTFSVYAHEKLIVEAVGFDDFLVTNEDNYTQIWFNEDNFTFHARWRPPPGTGIGFPMSNFPVVMVSWYGAALYCNWLSEKEGLEPVYDTDNNPLWPGWATLAGLQRNGYRLPTEAEWERAAAWDGFRHRRYGTNSDGLSWLRANYNDANPFNFTARPFTSPVGWYNGVNPFPRGGDNITVDAASPIGAYDMCGNVMEWCHCAHNRDYPWNQPRGETLDNPTELLLTGPQNNQRTVRGGSWSCSAINSRAAYRHGRWGSGLTQDERRNNLGFRIVRPQ